MWVLGDHVSVLDIGCRDNTANVCEFEGTCMRCADT